MKNTKRIKMKLAQVPASRAEADELMTHLAASTNELRELTAERDDQVLGINQEYADDLAAIEARLKTMTEELRAWAEANPGEFPKDAKSIKLANGMLGFRTGTPSLKLVSRAWNWEKVLGAVQTFLPAFIRNKPEVDKEQIIAQRAELEFIFPKIGVKVTQEESFFVEPQLTETPSRHTVAA